MPPLRALLFLLFTAGLSAVVHRFLWARLIRDPGWPEPWSTLGGVAFAALAAILLLGFLLFRVAPRGLGAPAAWAGYVWMGLLFYLLLALIPLELGRLGVHVGSSLGLLELPDPGRRALLSQALAGAVGVGAGLLGLSGMLTVARGPLVTRTTIPLRGLDPGLAGLKVAQLTDVHIGPTLGADFLERVVRDTNALEPDLVVITGDLVDGPVSLLGEAVRPLAGLRSRYGTFFVTGNHEYYSGVLGWIAHLESLGVRVLRNERVRIEGAEGAALELAGVDDYRARGLAPGHGADMERAVAGRDPRAPLVLLAHQPKAVHEAARLGVDLQISGHTHGGQLKPWDRLVKLDQPAVAGLHRFGDTWLYVSRGTGYWGPPLRVGVPAEIALLELVPAQA